MASVPLPGGMSALDRLVDTDGSQWHHCYPQQLGTATRQAIGALRSRRTRKPAVGCAGLRDDPLDTERPFRYPAHMPSNRDARPRLQKRLDQLADLPGAAVHSLTRRRTHSAASRQKHAATSILKRLDHSAKLDCSLATATETVLANASMAIRLDDYENLTQRAVAQFWRTLEAQGEKQKSNDADRGERAAVTGGKQMGGFCTLVSALLRANGVGDVSIYVQQKLELPGYFRPTKTWDMLVVRDGHLIAAIEFKSQRGPSFGNNFNNRTEEAIGTAHDLWVAYREGAFGKAQRPWLGWVMVLEDCKKSTTPVKVAEPHFKVFPEFQGASYALRYELLLRRLTREKLFDRAAFLMTTKAEGLKGQYREPSMVDLGMKQFLAGLLAHALAYEATLK